MLFILLFVNTYENPHVDICRLNLLGCTGTVERTVISGGTRRGLYSSARWANAPRTRKVSFTLPKYSRRLATTDTVTHTHKHTQWSN